MFGLPEDRLLFFFKFDIFLSIDRKNPLAVVRAFKRAFKGAGAHPKVGLVLKTLNADHVPERSRALRDALREDPDIALIEGTLARTEVLGLIGACDAVVFCIVARALGCSWPKAWRWGNLSSPRIIPAARNWYHRGRHGRWISNGFQSVWANILSTKARYGRMRMSIMRGADAQGVRGPAGGGATGSGGTRI